VHSIEHLAITDGAFSSLMAEDAGPDDDWLPKDIDTALKTFGNLKTTTMVSTDSYGPYPKKSSKTFKECCQRLQQEKDRLSLECSIPEIAPAI
jgi:hypothetical protein